MTSMPEDQQKRVSADKVKSALSEKDDLMREGMVYGEDNGSFH